MSGFLRLSVSFYLLQLFQATPLFVDGRRINIQKRFTKSQVCRETINTILKVDNCPSDNISLEKRIQLKQCEKVNHTTCSNEIFVYHCVRFQEDLVELCAPRGLITGGCCAQFNEGVGRVIEDYNVLCSECPLNYYTNETCKYQTCVRPRKTASITTISNLLNDASIPKVFTSNISTTNKIDCGTSGRSKRHVKCIFRGKFATESKEATSILTSPASNENSGVRPIGMRTSVVYISVAVAVILGIIITSLMVLYYIRKRSFQSCIASKENTENFEEKNAEHEKLKVSHKVCTVDEIANLINENNDYHLQTGSTSTDKP